LGYVYGTLVLTARVPAYASREAVMDGTVDISG